MDFDYKKYSLENLENWMHDAMSSGEATPQEIYDVIIGVVKENYYHHKHHTSQAYELLSKLNGHPTEYKWLDNKKTTSQDRGFEAVSGKDYVENYYKNVMPSSTQRDINNQKNLSCNKDDPSPECKGVWNDFWEDNQQYTEEELNARCDAAEEKHSKHYYDYTRNDLNRKNPFDKTLTYDEAKDAGWEMTADGFWLPPQEKDKVKKWVLPVEEAKDADTDETDYFVSFPDDLLEATDLKEGDQVEWVDNNDGSYTLTKVTKSTDD